MAWVIQNYEHTWNKSQTKWTSRHFTFEIHLDKFDLQKDGFETQNPYCCVIIIIYGEIPFHSVKNILKPVKRGGEGEIHGEQNSRIFFVGRHLTPLAPLPIHVHTLIITRIVNIVLGGAAIYLAARVATLAIIPFTMCLQPNGIEVVRKFGRASFVRSCLVMRILSGRRGEEEEEEKGEAQFRPLWLYFKSNCIGTRAREAFANHRYDLLLEKARNYNVSIWCASTY